MPASRDIGGKLIMKNFCSGLSSSRVPVCFLLLLIVSTSFLVAGCGASGPEAAVERYLDAYQSMNWDDYKASVTPDQELSAEQEELVKQEFEQVKVECEGLKFETEYVEGDENKAVVQITDGKISYTAEILGEKKTETESIKDMPKEQRPVFTVVKIKDKWYVEKSLDKPLS